MALTDESNGMGTTMLVQPSGYGVPYGGGFGNGLFGNCGDSWLGILFLIAMCNGGFGFGGFGGGYGAMMGMGMMDGFGLYPWLNNSQNINDGFRDQQLSTQVSGIQNAVTSGFGDVQMALCGGFAGVNQNISQGFANTNLGMCQGFNGVNAAINGAQNTISQQMYTNEIANLNRSFAEQTANVQGFNGVNAGLADTKYTIAAEACANRTASASNTRDIIDSQTRGTQVILDKLCQLELDGYKRENDQLRAENSTLKNQSFVANEINQQNEVFYNRLKNCPVNAVPVAGNTPLFSCNPGFNTPGCGCGA